MSSHSIMPAAYQRRQSSEPQTSLSLDRKVITQVSPESSRSGFATSLESVNNFINFCATVNLPLTDGKRITEGSCNPAPMGSIPSIDNIPSVKFQSPTNGVTFKNNTPIIVSLAINNLKTESFVNTERNYLSAPQQLSPEGMVLGHSSIVIEKINALDQTDPLDPTVFSFVSSPEPATNGTWTVNVTQGLSVGFYRSSAMIRTTNHYPIAVSVLQHGAMDDAVYFAVTSDGQPPDSDRTSLGSYVQPPADVSVSINTTDPNTDPSNQNSTTLISSVIASGFASNGQEILEQGRKPSLTSVNNFINYCLLGLDTSPITNGGQSRSSSCSPTPIGMIPPIGMMPSHKFQAPKHGDTIPANTSFLVRLNRRNMKQAMTDLDIRYLSAPQQIDSSGAILGYSRIVIEALTAINQTSVTDPRKIAFSTALSQVDENGAMMTNITDGLPDGLYRLSSIALTANHYPVVLPTSQHGAVNDAIYFTVGNGGSGSTAANSTIPAGPGDTGKANPTPTSDPQRSGSSNVGAAVGGALGGLALIALIIALLFFRQRKRRMAKVPPPLRPGEIQPYYIGPGEGPFLAGKRSEKQSHSALEPSNSTPGSSSGELQTHVDAGSPSTTTNVHRMETVMSSAPSYHTLEDRR